MQTLKRFETADLDLLVSLQPQDWSDIRPHFRFYINSAICQPMKYMLNDQMVGVGAIIFHKNTAWLAHIIVGSAFRNQGLGTNLTSALVDQIDKKRHASIYLIATDLGYPVYLKVGFDLVGTYNQLKRVNTNNHHQPSNHIKAYKKEFYNEIMAMDHLISGEDRSKFLMPYVEDSFLWRKSDVISGVYFPTMYDGYIMATRHDAGRELLTVRAKQFDYAILPSENKLGLHHLNTLGFEIKSRSRIMRIGTTINRQSELIYNRISGQIG